MFFNAFLRALAALCSAVILARIQETADKIIEVDKVSEAEDRSDADTGLCLVSLLTEKAWPRTS